METKKSFYVIFENKRQKCLDTILQFFQNSIMQNFLVLLLILAILLPAHVINAGRLVTQCPGSRELALTFDDGPHPGVTENILNILDDYGIKATFFILGRNLSGNDARRLLKKIYHQGHSIGTHSWNHEYMGQMSLDEVRREMQSTINEIDQILGFRPSLFRPPYGQINDYMYSYAKKVVTWGYDTEDWKLTNNGVTVDSVVAGVKEYLNGRPNGPILLLHDLCYENGEVLRRIIPIIKNMGYRFVTLD